MFETNVNFRFLLFVLIGKIPLTLKYTYGTIPIFFLIIHMKNWNILYQVWYLLSNNKNYLSLIMIKNEAFDDFDMTVKSDRHEVKELLKLKFNQRCKIKKFFTECSYFIAKAPTHLLHGNLMCCLCDSKYSLSAVWMSSLFRISRSMMLQRSLRIILTSATGEDLIKYFTIFFCMLLIFALVRIKNLIS